MTKRRDKGRLPSFVPLLKDTLASPAWKAMSHGARSLYIALKLRYSSNFKNNGRLYLSQRDAAEEIGSHTNQVARWFRELEYHGFIVKTRGGSLGVDGKGKAPHWRLTEVGYMTDPPTRDFMRWNGITFDSHRPGGDRPLKTESRPPFLVHPVLEKGDTSVLEKGDTNGNKCPRKGGHTARPGVLEKGDITSLPLVGPASGPQRRLPWTTPTITEVADPAEVAALRKACGE
jgi:hypothetical protein